MPGVSDFDSNYILIEKKIGGIKDSLNKCFYFTYVTKCDLLIHKKEKQDITEQ